MKRILGSGVLLACLSGVLSGRAQVLSVESTWDHGVRLAGALTDFKTSELRPFFMEPEIGGLPCYLKVRVAAGTTVTVDAEMPHRVDLEPEGPVLVVGNGEKVSAAPIICTSSAVVYSNVYVRCENRDLTAEEEGTLFRAERFIDSTVEICDCPDNTTYFQSFGNKTTRVCARNAVITRIGSGDVPFELELLKTDGGPALTLSTPKACAITIHRLRGEGDLLLRGDIRATLPPEYPGDHAGRIRLEDRATVTVGSALPVAPQGAVGWIGTGTDVTYHSDPADLKITTDGSVATVASLPKGAKEIGLADGDALSEVRVPWGLEKVGGVPDGKIRVYYDDRDVTSALAIANGEIAIDYDGELKGVPLRKVVFLTPPHRMDYGYVGFSFESVPFLSYRMTRVESLQDFGDPEKEVRVDLGKAGKWELTCMEYDESKGERRAFYRIDVVADDT